MVVSIIVERSDFGSSDWVFVVFDISAVIDLLLEGSDVGVGVGANVEDVLASSELVALEAVSIRVIVIE